MKKKIECTIPILSVNSLKESVDYYVDTLGFSVDWKGQVVGSVSRDGCNIMLSEQIGASGSGWVWIGLRDASLFDEYKTKGVKVHQEPRNHEWAYEMKFQDPDGNILWLGTDTRDDLPKL